MIRKSCCSRFLLHKFIHLKYFWTQLKNVHLRGPCGLRPCISITEHLMKLNPNVDNKNLITKLGICITKIVIRHHSHICAGVLWKKNPSGYGFSFYKLATITPKYIYIICRCLFPATTFLFFFQALNKKKSYVLSSSPIVKIIFIKMNCSIIT